MGRQVAAWELWVSLPFVYSYRPAPPVAQAVKNRPAAQETLVPSPGQEDPLEKEMATHSRILAWEIPWTEEPGGLESRGCEESDTTEQLTLSLLHFHFHHPILVNAA